MSETMSKKPGIFIVIALLFAGGCGMTKSAQKDMKSFAKPPIPVEVVKVRRASIVQTAEVSGNIKSESEVSVVSKLQARVKSVRVKEGDKVKRGQTLLVLEGNDISAQVKQAEAQVMSAKARLDMAMVGARPQEKKQAEESLQSAKVAYEVAKTDYERMEVLHSHGSISDQQYDQTKARYEDTKTRYESLKQQLEMVREGPRSEEKEAAKAALLSAQASLQYYKSLLSYTRITSPCSCSVAAKMVDAGEMAAPGVPLLKLVDNSRLYFEADVSDRQSSLYKEGQAVTVRVDGVPDKMFSSSVARVYPSVDSVSRSVKIKIVLEQTDLQIVAGMFARGSVEVNKKDNAVIVEKDSVRFTEKEPYAFVVQDGKAIQRKLNLGISNDKHVEVLSGLTEGEMVVITGSPDLSDGVAVKVVEPDTKS